jgi:tight adherence protein B
VTEAIAFAAALATAMLVGGLATLGRAGVQRYRAAIARLAQQGLADLFLFVEPARLFRWSLAALSVLLALAYALGGGAFALAATAAAGLALPRAVQSALRRRRARRLVRQLPDALSALAGALRAGLGLPQALATLAEQQPGPLRDEFALVLRKQRLGLSLDHALVELGARIGRPEYDLFVTSVRIARELGSNLAESLERLADTLRRKSATEAKIEALTAQGRLQGWIVGLLPLGLMGVLNWLEPQAMRALWTTPAGWTVLGIVAVLLGLGALSIARIVKIDV